MCAPPEQRCTAGSERPRFPLPTQPIESSRHVGTSPSDNPDARAEGQLSRRLFDNLFVFVGLLDVDGTVLETNSAPLVVPLAVLLAVHRLSERTRASRSVA